MIFLLVALFAACPAVASAQERGSLEGHVLDGRTQQPLANALLSVVGGHLQARTDDSGFFRLAPLAPGPLNVRIQRPGYAAAIEPVDVVEAEKVEFQLFSAATVLEALVVRVRASEVTTSRDGAKTTAIRPDERRSAAAVSSTDLIARVPGALVISGGQLGSGSSVRLRGLKSLFAAGNPLIYVDGVRVSGGEFRIGGGPAAGAGAQRGGMFRRYTEPTVLDQLDPSSIDHIEVLPGAAATTLYGTGAANGMILIYTKR